MKIRCEMCKEEIEGEEYYLDDLTICKLCYEESLENDDRCFDEHKISEAEYREER